jgi:hypothetical protein
MVKTPKTTARAPAPKVDLELRERAARQAGKALREADPADVVTARVMKLGDGKISTGQHVPGVGEVHYERGEEFTTARAIAQDLEERGYVEIVEPE